MGMDRGEAEVLADPHGHAQAHAGQPGDPRDEETEMMNAHR